MRGIGDVTATRHTHRRSSLPYEPPEIWGVLNVTPDSFSDGGRYLDASEALERGRAILAEGADVVDVGGESSRPAGRTYGDGAVAVPVAEELARVLPVVEGLVALGARVSIDTVKPEVARHALAAGARIVNDVSCGADELLFEVAAAAGAEYVLMHNRGRGEITPETTRYEDLVRDVAAELERAVERAMARGLSREAIWIDPGLGFAKTPAQSLALLAATSSLVGLGHRVLVGPSRKAFIAECARLPDGGAPAVGERVGGTAGAVTVAVLGGARAVRVHDVAVARQAALVAAAVRGLRPTESAA